MATALDQRRAQVLEGIDEIPPFPDVASRVLTMAQDPDTSAADLARAISRDASLTARILRSANSMAVGGSKQTTSLPDGIVRLGLKSVRDIVVVDCLPASSRKEATDLERVLWERSVASALCARGMGMQQRSSDTELDFLSGLFYDVGRFHLNSSFPEEYALLFSAADDEFDWIEAEREQFGIDHTEVGATILKRWDFDEQLRAAARRHHDDPSALDGLPLRMAAVDELLPCPVERDEDGGIQLSTPSGPESACAELGLIGEELDTFCDRVRAVVDREIRFFVTAA